MSKDKMATEQNINSFNRDVGDLNGYAYTTDRLSCKTANTRITDAVLEMAAIRGKRVIDIGCGGGTYSHELFEAGAKSVLGVDAAESAVEMARKRAAGKEGLRFEIRSVYDLEVPEQRYDVAVVRGLLHHLYDAPRAIERICQQAHEIVVVEPNGYNPVLKVIEKTSSYHIEHEEKSFAPFRLEQWFRQCGARVTDHRYIGLVPSFCPDFAVRILKRVEGPFERTRILRCLRSVGCCLPAPSIYVAAGELDEAASPQQRPMFRSAMRWFSSAASRRQKPYRFVVTRSAV